MRFPIRAAGIAAALAWAAALSSQVAAQDSRVEELLRPIRAVGKNGQGTAAAARAWGPLSKLEADQLPAVLEGMDGANVLADNWIRSAADAIAARTLAKGGSLPVKQLEAFLADAKHSPRGRRTAYELIRRVDDSAESRLIPGLLDDPSMELRYDAVRLAEAEANKQLESGARQAAKAAYLRVFRSARNLEQVQSIAKQLEELGEKPDLAAHFGFLRRWKLVGPFNNKDKSGFDVPYGPEADTTQPSYSGLEGEVKWFSHASEDDLGEVDINKALGRHKGAICYALAEFRSPRAQDCELRLGCINAHKVWLNGKLLISNHVYHSGQSVDQYVGRGQLKAGANQILVKVAQNEQEEQWAQEWQFQLRVCDALGTAILSADRPVPRAARVPHAKLR